MLWNFVEHRSHSSCVGSRFSDCFCGGCVGFGLERLLFLHWAQLWAVCLDTTKYPKIPNVSRPSNDIKAHHRACCCHKTIHSLSTSPVLLSHIKAMKITTSFMLLLATAASASAAEHSGIRGPFVADGTFDDSVVKSAAIKHTTKGLEDDTQETLFVKRQLRQRFCTVFWSIYLCGCKFSRILICRWTPGYYSWLHWMVSPASYRIGGIHLFL